MSDKPDLGLMKNVVPIIGRSVDEQGIVILKKMLAQAEKGEILSVGIVAEKTNGDVAVCFSQGIGKPIVLLGAISMLMRQIQDHLIGGRTKTQL